MSSMLVVAACHRDVAGVQSATGRDDVLAETCASRRGCHIERSYAASEPSGEPLEVVAVWLDTNVCPECEPCPDVEYWLVAHRPLRARLLVAAGLTCMQWGGGGVEIRPNALTYTFAGSGAPISGVEPVVTTITLSPLGVLSQTIGARAVSTPPVPTRRSEPILDYRGRD